MEEHTNSIVNHLGGYHRCYLDDPIHLEFASDNLCSMLGYSKHELENLIGDIYTTVMHPDDTAAFEDFAVSLAAKEDCQSVAYRLIKKDGSIIRVVDTMASVRGDDGCMRGYSVVCEIPDEGSSPTASSPSEKIAVIRIAGGVDPIIEKACGIGQQLLGIEGEAKGLRFLDYVSLVDRDKIKVALKRAYEGESSGMELCTIVSAAGHGIACDLWVECIAPGSCLEDSSFCVKAEMDFSYHKEDNEMLSFSKMLFSSFSEDVFEVDRTENTIRYICQSDTYPIEAPINVRMNADDFLEWFLYFISPDDRDAVKRFCIETKSLSLDWSKENSGPTKIKFEMIEEYRSERSVALVMVPISKSKYFLCFNPDFTSMGPGFCSAAVAERKHIVARLFDSFSLLVDGKAVHIKCEKGRELLALLIEKRGAYLTTREAITSLWECEPDETTRARYRKIASRLMTELKKNGIDYIIESERGARRIIPEFIECDYYDYRDGLIEAPGDLLPEYSWAEYVRVD